MGHGDAGFKNGGALASARRPLKGGGASYSTMSGNRPPLMNLPSMTTRSASGSAPKRRSRSRDIQWQAARLPWMSRGGAKVSDAVHIQAI